MGHPQIIWNIHARLLGACAKYAAFLAMSRSIRRLATSGFNRTHPSSFGVTTALGLSPAPLPGPCLP